LTGIQSGGMARVPAPLVVAKALVQVLVGSGEKLQESVQKGAAMMGLRPQPLEVEEMKCGLPGLPSVQACSGWDPGQG